LTYQKDFPLKAYEHVKQTDTLSCTALTQDSDPTCGWQYTPQNQKLAYSQGFCCKCDLLNLQGEFELRGASCSLVNLWKEDAASAHCLRFDTTMEFKGYTVEAPRVEFDINV
jgi:hypothetical protein